MSLPAFPEMATADLRRYVDRHLRNGCAHALSADAAARLEAASAELARRGSLRVREYGDRRWEFTLFGRFGVVVAHLDDFRAESLARAAGAAAAARLGVVL